MSHNSHRLSLDIPESTYSAIESVRATLGVATKTEVIRRAVSLLQLATQAEAAGGKIAIDSGNGKLERVRMI